MSLHTRDDINLGRSYDDIELRGLKIKSNPLHAFSTKQRSPTYLSMIKRTALQVINQILAINGRGDALSFCIASILISAFILLMLRPAVAVAATFDNEISYFSGSKQVTSTRVLYTYPDTATTDKPMNVSVIIRYLNNTYAIPKWINLHDISVHLRKSVKGPNIFNSTIDASDVMLTPGGKPYSRVFYVTPTIPGNYFLLLNYDASLGPPFKDVAYRYDERTEIYPSEVSPVNIVKK